MFRSSFLRIDKAASMDGWENLLEENKIFHILIC